MLRHEKQIAPFLASLGRRNDKGIKNPTSGNFGRKWGTQRLDPLARFMRLRGSAIHETSSRHWTKPG